MAKDKNVNQDPNKPADEAQAAAGGEAPANTTSTSTTDASDERYKMITDPASGKVMRRVDFIRDLWKTGQYTRGEIAKKVTEIQGKKCLYQIVFAATKNIPGGKKADGSTVGEKATTEAPANAEPKQDAGG